MKLKHSVLILALMSVFSFTLLAHEEHEPTTSDSIVQDTLVNENSITEPSSLLASLLSHPHNKLVHFPIALGIFAFIFFILAIRWNNLRISAELLVMFGFLASVVAVIFGELQKSAFIGTEKESLVLTHERFGWATSIGFFLWLILMRWKPTQRWAWLIGLGVVILLTITGFFGGQLAH